jgi:hypothetical protein
MMTSAQTKENSSSTRRHIYIYFVHTAKAATHQLVLAVVVSRIFCRIARSLLHSLGSKSMVFVFKQILFSAFLVVVCMQLSSVRRVVTAFAPQIQRLSQQKGAVTVSTRRWMSQEVGEKTEEEKAAIQAARDARK